MRESVGPRADDIVKCPHCRKRIMFKFQGYDWSHGMPTWVGDDELFGPPKFVKAPAKKPKRKKAKK